MPTAIFVGGAPAVAQVNTETPATVEIGDEFYIRLENHAGENHEIGFTATATTVANVVTGLQAAAAAAKAAGTAPWDEVTCTDDTTVMTITAVTAGVPFYITTRVVNGGANDTQTLTDANTVACAGPSIFNTPENWDSGSFFADADDIVIRADVAALIYGGDYTSGKANKITAEEGFSQNVGSQAHPLQLACTGKTDKKVYWWGTGICYLDIDAAVDIYIFDCGSSADTGLYDLNLVGLDNDSVHFQPSNSSARCGLASGAGEVFEVAHIYQSDGVLKIGYGAVFTDGAAVITDCTITGGEAVSYSTVGIGVIYNQGNGGTLDYMIGPCATLYAWAGTTRFSSPGNITTKLHVGSGASFDLSGTKEASTITACDAYANSTIEDPGGRASWSAGIVTVGCNAQNITLVTKPGGTLTPS